MKVFSIQIAQELKIEGLGCTTKHGLNVECKKAHMRFSPLEMGVLNVPQTPKRVPQSLHPLCQKLLLFVLDVGHIYGCCVAVKMTSRTHVF
jgi:hypothetical protein